jgi:diguanylate cyclase (GGDEF)-like protein
MVSSEALLAILAVTIALLVGVAVALVAALNGRGPLYGRFVEVERRPRERGETWRGNEPSRAPERFDFGDLAEARPRSTVRVVPRERRLPKRGDGANSRASNLWDDELNAVLHGSYAAASVNRAVRILAWSFILVILLIVAVSNRWPDEQVPIYATLILAGVFVLIGHEISPSPRPGTARILVEASVGIFFIALLVAFTGNASSPFFFLFPLLVGGIALITHPIVAVALTVEAAGAFVLVALAGPIDGQAGRDAAVRVGINLAALILLSYSGMVIARVQRQTRDAAVRLSTLDPLTDLYNRAFLFNAVEREIQRGRRFKRGFCLLMMDLDGLKAINDRFGHFQGDTVLRGVAQLITDGLRAIDVASRYGGDEFVAVLPETDPSGAYVVAEKIRRTVADMIVETGGQQIRTSLSIGVVSYPDDGQTSDELMIAADEAMYSSKRLGKNKVVGYAEPSEGVEPDMGRWPHTPTPGFRPLPRDPTNWPPDNGEDR